MHGISKKTEGNIFNELYPQKDIEESRLRYAKAALSYKEIFGGEHSFFVSAPGRCEIIGNHTDHQKGRVLAAAVDVDCLCAVSPNGLPVIKVFSDGFGEFEVSLNELEPVENEEPSAALVRGLMRFLQTEGIDIKGFFAYVTSDVLPGSGLSSSAAFETALALAAAKAADCELTPLVLAKAGRFAENNYMRKPSGLLDQAVIAEGGLCLFDFAKEDNPVAEKLELSGAFDKLAFCVTDTKGSHAGLNAEYAAIPLDMISAANYFGKECLKDVPYTDFCNNIINVRKQTSDRAVLRAIHFYEETERVKQAAEALKNNDTDVFMRLINESGLSSETVLHNVFRANGGAACELSLALKLTRKHLGQKGVCRVQGGGFAGTILTILPKEDVKSYITEMDSFFGGGAARVLQIRKHGAVCVPMPPSSLLL